MNRPASAPEMSLLELAGTPREMGRAHGEHWREAIAELCEARVRSTLNWADVRGRSLGREALLGAMPPFLEHHRRWCPEVYDEFLGIAEGAGLDPALLLIGNGYTDIRDAVAFAEPTLGGCTTFSATGEATADGTVWAGQTWDMDQSMLPFVFVCRRNPSQGPRTVTVTTCGCLSLIGINEAGVAVGNSNITPRDARAGVIYLAMIHQALAQPTLDGAVAAITSAPRASGHHYYLADERRAVHLETTATRWAELPRDGACHAQSNDYRHTGFGDLPIAPLPEGRSIERRTCLGEALRGRGPLERRGMQAALESNDVRVELPVGTVITCASALLHPAGREMFATHGPPRESAWRSYVC